MSKIIDIIFNDMKKDKNIYFSLIIVMIISFIFGLFFISILSDSDKSLVLEHITLYFDSIKSGSFIPNLYNNIMNNDIVVIILWILGFSMIGFPIIISILFYKSFTLIFSITSLIYNFRIDGILISFIYIFPHLVLNLLFYFIMSFYSFKFCLNLVGSILHKNKIKSNFLKKYIIILLISITFVTISAIYETYILPYLIKLIY